MKKFVGYSARTPDGYLLSQIFPNTEVARQVCSQHNLPYESIVKLFVETEEEEVQDATEK